MKNIILLLTKTDNSWALVPFRIVLGLVMLAHGAQKLFGWFGGYGLEATGMYFEENLGMSPGYFWAFLAAAGEFFGGLFLMLGIFTRLQGAVLTITMLVALFVAHSSSFFLPSGMEYVLVLAAGSLLFALSGGGSASVDAQIHKKLSQ